MYSKLVKSSSIYILTSFINASIPLLLLPLLTDKLSPTGYGILAMFQICVGIILPFISLNLDGALARKYYDKEKGDFRAYFGTTILIGFISLLIVSVSLLFFIDLIHNITSIPHYWIKYILVVAYGQFIVSIVLTYFQVTIQPLKYGFVQISQSVVNIGLTLIFILYYAKNWEGRLEAIILTGLVFIFLSFIILFKKKLVKFKIYFKDVKYALSYGIPLIPHAFGALLFTAIDRFFLTNIIGLDQTGNFTVAYQLGAIISLVTVAFNNAFVPWLFENLNKDDLTIKKKIVSYTYVYFIFLFFLAFIVLTIFPFLVSIFVDEKYSDVNNYSFFIVLGFVFQGMYFMVTNYIIYENKTYIQAIITISTAIFKIPITYYLITFLGAEGASVSYCISYFLFFVITWYVSSKVYKMPWMLKINFLK